MESQKSQSIARKGSVQIKNSNGSLQLVFSHFRHKTILAFIHGKIMSNPPSLLLSINPKKLVDFVL
ncbi:hypothetical protein CEN44_07355 [Fischerella muscicola CCMEE 5323]|uniref:Uncharacterized protein n=1 Tax=Fischerella muscicola CCMEE 5323 TaxID=2019572 RepID=A0A2N6K5L5_FISMU|nr:hypothetical protein CEN44_07355 [Fischerella muscicola CCMEE 5323]